MACRAKSKDVSDIAAKRGKDCYHKIKDVRGDQHKKGRLNVFLEEVNESYWYEAVCNKKLPELNEEEDWKVWLVKGIGYLTHHSLTLQSIEKGGSFTMELIVYETETPVFKQTVTPVSTTFDWDREEVDLECKLLGTIITTAESFFQTALNCLDRYGDYSVVKNNCQGYIKALAKAYGLETGDTDLTKTVKYVMAPAVAHVSWKAVKKALEYTGQAI